MTRVSVSKANNIDLLVLTVNGVHGGGIYQLHQQMAVKQKPKQTVN